MQLFFTPEIKKNIAALNLQESRHCLKVLRKRKGEKIHITNGKGKLFVGQLLNEDHSGCLIKVMEEVDKERISDFWLHIAIAPVKNVSRFEWFLEKATEIGVNEITPVLCDHSEKQSMKHERMEKILISAMKQAGRYFLPKLNGIESFQKFLKKISTENIYMANYDESHLFLSQVYKKNTNCVILIGPEGDFSESEKDMARDMNATFVNISNYRLRTETAGIVACHTVNMLNQ